MPYHPAVRCFFEARPRNSESLLPLVGSTWRVAAKLRIVALALLAFVAACARQEPSIHFKRRVTLYAKRDLGGAAAEYREAIPPQSGRPQDAQRPRPGARPKARPGGRPEEPGHPSTFAQGRERESNGMACPYGGGQVVQPSFQSPRKAPGSRFPPPPTVKRRTNTTPTGLPLAKSIAARSSRSSDSFPAFRLPFRVPRPGLPKPMAGAGIKVEPIEPL